MEPKHKVRLQIACSLCGLPIRADDEEQLVEQFREHMWEQHRQAMSEDRARQIVHDKLQASAENPED